MEVIGRAKQDARAESNAGSSYRGITFHLKHLDPLDLKTWFCIWTYLCRERHDAGNDLTPIIRYNYTDPTDSISFIELLLTEGIKSPRPLLSL